MKYWIQRIELNEAKVSKFAKVGLKLETEKAKNITKIDYLTKFDFIFDRKFGVFVIQVFIEQWLSNTKLVNCFIKFDFTDYSDAFVLIWFNFRLDSYQ